MAIENLTALITGGSGQIGLAITEYLQSHHPSTKIHILDISTPIKPSPGIIYHIGSIADASAISSQFSLVKPEIVFHTAGLIPSIAARLGMDKEKDFMNINLEGTRIILEEAKEAGVKAFVYTSSADRMKGNSWQDLRGVDEEMPIPEVFDNPYGKSKVIILLFGFPLYEVGKDLSENHLTIDRLSWLHFKLCVELKVTCISQHSPNCLYTSRNIQAKFRIPSCGDEFLN